MDYNLSYLTLIILQLLLGVQSVAFSRGCGHLDGPNVSDNATILVERGHIKHCQTDQKPLLRLMPLGASITQGYDPHIADNLQNGYRKPLREELRYRGYAVNMVGSRSEGDFFDRQHEGWPGLEINDVAQKMLPVMAEQKPNLVLILLGTNDCMHAKRDKNMTYVGTAKDRMRTMIENIYTLSPGVTIIFATLPATRDDEDTPYIQIINAGYMDLANELQGLGRKIELVDMHTSWLRPEDYTDNIHFKPQGYAKLAALFANAFAQVEAKGWLSAPIDTDIADNSGCYPHPDSFQGPVRTQRGSGYDDGEYAYASVFELNKNFTYKESASQPPLGHFQFANLVALTDENQARDELIRVLSVHHNEPKVLPFVSYYANHGDGTFDTTAIPVKVGQNCLSENVRWGDVDGDGLDDFICLDADGLPLVSLNRGGAPPRFEFIGLIHNEKTMQSKVRLADIDGDGKVDFCNIETYGVYCWRNSGTIKSPHATFSTSWEGMLMNGGGPTLDIESKLDPARVRFIDLTGNGRADWIYFQNATNIKILLNQRGDHTDGKGLKPHWTKATVGIERWPQTESYPQNILFGRVFGSGRNDIVLIQQLGSSFDYVFHFIRNTGKGGTELRGDGVRYCDMFGRGYDDYLWIGANGTIELYENIQSPPLWSGPSHILDTKYKRKFIHVGDWDGDGLCDVLAVDRLTGNVDMWRNTYKKGNTVPTFDASIRVVDSSPCPQPDISGSLYDLAVRFGDLDGDSRVDYICVSPLGFRQSWLNKPRGLEQLPQMNPTQDNSVQEFSRAEQRWADVNGDGLVDFLGVDAHTGNGTVWINSGIAPGSMTGIKWDKRTDIYLPGMERGANIHFPKLSKSGRADYHVVYPRSAVADTWYNEAKCRGAMDDGEVKDPGLPTPPAGS